MKRISKRDWEIIEDVVSHFVEYDYAIRTSMVSLSILEKHMPGVFKIVSTESSVVCRICKAENIPDHILVKYWRGQRDMYQDSYFKLVQAMDRVLEKY